MRFRLPHPFVLLLGTVCIAAALTWVIPAGEYQRRTDAATGREVVVAGTYARVEASPVRPMGALLAVPRGIIAGADVILTILMVEAPSRCWRRRARSDDSWVRSWDGRADLD